jgi:hypothetical protein
MSADRAAEEVAPVAPQHYRVLCVLALAAMFLVQFQQGLMLGGIVVLGVGAVAILLRAPISPLLVLLPLVGGQLYLHYLFPRPHQVLQIEDVVLCTATLAYVGGHYRLMSLWRSILPTDPRQRYHTTAPVIVPLNRLGMIAPQHRPASLLSRGEMAWFVVQLPLFALLAQGAWLVLNAPRELLDLSPRWLQLLLLAWGLVLGMFIAGQLIRLARLLRMDRATAKMLLQDSLWHETRREQRRVGRWLAWFHLRRKRS